MSQFVPQTPPTLITAPPSLINTVLLAAVPGPDPQGEGGQQEQHGGDGQEARPDKVQSRP